MLGLKSCGQVVSGQIRVYHADRLGSVRWVTDGSQNIVARYVYEGFGKIVGQDDSETVPYRFCSLWGYRDDGDAGLLHVGARYYEAEIGRWIQKDLYLGNIINPKSLNCYAYCLLNPNTFIDPQGTISVPILVMVALAVLVLAGCGEKQEKAHYPPSPGRCPHGVEPGKHCGECRGVVTTCPCGQVTGNACPRCGPVKADPPKPLPPRPR